MPVPTPAMAQLPIPTCTSDASMANDPMASVSAVAHAHLYLRHQPSRCLTATSPPALTPARRTLSTSAPASIFNASTTNAPLLTSTPAPTPARQVYQCTQLPTPTLHL
ncbi:hypothetical protein BDQ12DRAFT_677660 [Crucibulum laeve]|uniref:Uncharacterized protein n=1 Tax=Crucibulum laeve TaxID=68775 RepID=A0A5C3MB48_9AGAR|nr:hypothetical protein BDQ12DRAFT_677660 [Crucibulum laeve]